MDVSLLHNRLKMHEFLLKEKERLCRKYGVKDIASVLEIQDKILKRKYKFIDEN